MRWNKKSILINVIVISEHRWKIVKIQKASLKILIDYSETVRYKKTGGK